MKMITNIELNAGYPDNRREPMNNLVKISVIFSYSLLIFDKFKPLIKILKQFIKFHIPTSINLLLNICIGFDDSKTTNPNIINGFIKERKSFANKEIKQITVYKPIIANWL